MNLKRRKRTRPLPTARLRMMKRNNINSCPNTTPFDSNMSPSTLLSCWRIGCKELICIHVSTIVTRLPHTIIITGNILPSIACDKARSIQQYTFSHFVLATIACSISDDSLHVIRSQRLGLVLDGIFERRYFRPLSGLLCRQIWTQKQLHRLLFA